MNNEIFGITFQYAICREFNLVNDISIERIDNDILSKITRGNIIRTIFRNLSRPIKFISNSKEYTSPFIKRCPHNFLLKSGETFSIKTLVKKNKMFAPKVVGQSGDDTFNHFFRHLSETRINRNNFKAFCLSHINEMLPILIDYALVSDYNCFLYSNSEGSFEYDLVKRDNLADLSFNYEDFSFSKNSVETWNESNTVKFKGKTLIELQIHRNRMGYKIRLHRKNFQELITHNKKLNNSVLGDSAELAVCNVFELDPGADNNRLINNSDRQIVGYFVRHYSDNKNVLFPLSPVSYGGTQKRDRGGSSKSGIDFFLENEKTLSLKTNQISSQKVCPPEIGQPSPKTFDTYFGDKGWYIGKIDEDKFRTLVKNKNILVDLLEEYIHYLNECDFLLWSLYLPNNNIESTLLNKSVLSNLTFDAEKINYSNEFTESSSVTIKYGDENFTIGEFQVHSARNSLKFRFHFGNLISFANKAI